MGLSFFSEGVVLFWVLRFFVFMVFVEFRAFRFVFFLFFFSICFPLIFIVFWCSYSLCFSFFDTEVSIYTLSVYSFFYFITFFFFGSYSYGYICFRLCFFASFRGCVVFLLVVFSCVAFLACLFLYKAWGDLV